MSEYYYSGKSTLSNKVWWGVVSTSVMFMVLYLSFYFLFIGYYFGFSNISLILAVGLAQRRTWPSTSITIPPAQRDYVKKEFPNRSFSKGIRDLIRYYQERRLPRLEERERELEEELRRVRDEIARIHEEERAAQEVQRGKKLKAQEQEIVRLENIFLKDIKTYFSYEESKRPKWMDSYIKPRMEELRGLGVDVGGFLRDSRDKEGVAEMLSILKERGLMDVTDITECTVEYSSDTADIKGDINDTK